MDINYKVIEGEPLSGYYRDKLIKFLMSSELSFESGIEYTVILTDNDKIIATGSIQGNVIKCVAVDEEYQGMGLMATVMTYLRVYMLKGGIKHYFVYTKPKNKKMFLNMDFYEIASTKEVLFLENIKDGINSYLESIKLNLKNDSCKKIGAVVVNCNPPTLGHRYLIEEALKQVDYLYVFLLAEENGLFRYNERYEMLNAMLADFENVYIYSTKSYLISKATFPVYFIKEKYDSDSIFCEIDLGVFCRYFVPKLDITTRFVGTEPHCNVTAQYNKEMKEYLPKNGVSVVEIARKEFEGGAISASYVRELIKVKSFDMLRNYLDSRVLKFIEEKFNIDN